MAREEIAREEMARPLSRNVSQQQNLPVNKKSSAQSVTPDI